MALAAEGLGLDDNGVALGTLTVAGTPSTQLVDSPVPLDVEAAAMTAYFGALHALAQDRLDWWRILAPGVPPPAGEVGTTITSYDSRLDVTVEATGDRATKAVMRAEVVLSNGTTRHLQATAAVEGHELLLTSWTING